MMLTEYDALHLSMAGWVILLAWLFGSRIFDWRTGRHRLPGYAAIQPLPVRWLMALIGVMIWVQAMRLAPSITAMLEGSAKANYPLPSLLLGMVLQHAAVAMFIFSIAYHPRWKAKWLPCWSALAHVAIWGPVLWR